MTLFKSRNPATGQVLWENRESSKDEIKQAVLQARKAFSTWSLMSRDTRSGFLKEFADLLEQNQDELATYISQETGKPLWEAKLELSSMILKVSISIEALEERCPEKITTAAHTTYSLRYKPHGVVAVFGPFNFPGHLPNGHIVPALLAGNTVVFKGSEYTPLFSEKMALLWNSILPQGVFHLLQGGPTVGQTLLSQAEINGVYFTGSLKTGRAILDVLGKDPEKILALEMGGNNPLVVLDTQDFETAAYTIVQSAYLTAGQRCSCARRLILLDSKENRDLLAVLMKMIASIRVGDFRDTPEPFMGPVISVLSMHALLEFQNSLEQKGGKVLVRMKQMKEHVSFLSPGLIDVTGVSGIADEEHFGPLLLLFWVKSFEEAIEKANDTQYGLVASLLSHDPKNFEIFFQRVRAGVINWNQPTTGASSRLPFGGVKQSGNHRPSAYYAADYCAYPVSGVASEDLHIEKPLPGLKF